MSEGALEGMLDRVVRRHAELADVLANPARLGGDFARLSKEYSDLAPLVETIAGLKKARLERAELAALAGEGDPEMRALAASELAALDKRLPALEHGVRLMLLPKDEADERNAILEMRAGTGGDEAALFAADLFRMYQRYAALHGWRFEVMAMSETGHRRLQGSDRLGLRPQRVRAPEIRIGRASGAARARDRGIGPHPYLGRDGRGAARSRGGRHPNRRQGPAHRRVPLERPGRPVGQHHRQRGAHHPSADRHRGAAAGREIAAQEQGQGAEGAARAPLRARARGGGRGAGAVAQEPGRQRRPLGAHPHL